MERTNTKSVDGACQLLGHIVTLDIELYVAIYIVRYDEADGEVQIA